MTPTPRRGATGLRQFLNPEQQRDWIEGKASLREQSHGRHAGEHGGTAADDRSESLEQRFKYVARFDKLLRRPQAEDILEILRLYAENCLPIPRQTERHYWSVSCLPSTSDKPLVRVNASWMELFTLYAEGEGIRARFIVHLSDFTTDQSATQDHLDEAFLEQCVVRAEDIGHSFPRGEDMLIITVRGSASIRQFLSTSRALRGIRTFNLTHMNRGRNAYQASHCYSVADYMLD